MDRLALQGHTACRGVRLQSVDDQRLKQTYIGLDRSNLPTEKRRKQCGVKSNVVGVVEESRLYSYFLMDS